MQNELLPEELKFEKASKKDLNKIVSLLKDANLFDYIPKNEIFENFYVVKPNKNIICCFTLDIENDIAILKSYAIKNELRGKGIGKNIAVRREQN